METGFFRTLLRRRVPQIVGVYLAAGWGVVEFMDWLIGRFTLSPHLIDFVGAGWLLLLPAVIVFAWGHGTPGRDRWTRPEKLAVGANLAGAGIALWALFGGRDLGAVTTTVVVEDEDGQAITRAVPKEAFRRKVALFALRDRTADGAHGWLQLAIPQITAVDLEQDPFLSTTWLFLEQRGDSVDRPRVLPLARQRELARDRFADAFLAGEIGGGPDTIEIVGRLHDAVTGSVLEESSLRGPDPLVLADSLSRMIRGALETPRLPDTPDLPAAELLSADRAAVRAWSEAGAWRIRDEARNVEALRRATARDTTFARAWWRLGEALSRAGSTDAAVEALERAMRHDYRLDEPARFSLKTDYYMLRGEPGKALRTARMKTSLYPEDAGGHEELAQILQLRGEYAEALTHYERALALEPGDQSQRIRLGNLYRDTGDTTRARQAFEAYAAAFPERVEPLLALADLDLVSGEIESARTALERALLLEPDDHLVAIRMADVERRLGDLDAGFETLREALRRAGNEVERLQLEATVYDHYEYAGMADSALALRSRLLEGERRLGGRAGALAWELSSLGVLARAGRGAEARARIEELDGQLEPPIDLYLSVGRALVALAEGDADRLEQNTPPFRDYLEQYGVGAAMWQVTYLEAEALRLRDRCAEALPMYAEAAAGMQRSFVLQFDLALGSNPIRAEGVCLREVGDFHGAEERFRRMLALVPSDPRTRVEWALLERARSRPEAARRLLEEALEVWARADAAWVPARRARLLRAEMLGAAGRARRGAGNPS